MIVKGFFSPPSLLLGLDASVRGPTTTGGKYNEDGISGKESLDRTDETTAPGKIKCGLNEHQQLSLYCLGRDFELQEFRVWTLQHN